MKNYNKASTPIAIGCSLDTDENGINYDQTRYKGLISTPPTN